MTATRPRLTAPPAGLLEAVERQYDAGPLTVTARLEGGWANDVFLVESAAGALVLRIKYPPSDPASIAWEHALLTRLAPDVTEVVAPIRARDGSTFFFHGRDAVWLVPRIDGEPVGVEHAEAAARVLGRVHAVTDGLEPPPRPGPCGLEQLRTLNANGLPSEWRARAARVHADVLALLDGLEARELRRGVVHGDIYRGNFLAHGDDIVALIDWEEAHVAPLVSELANGIWEFLRDHTDTELDHEAAARFAAAYRAAGGPVPREEDELIVPLIRAKRVLELLRAPTDRHVDWEYQAQNLRAAEKLA